MPTLKQAKQELQEAWEYAQAIIEAVPPLLVLDANLRVKTANGSFYKNFKVAPPQTEDCLVYELGNGQWNIPKLRTFLETRIAKFKVPERFIFSDEPLPRLGTGKIDRRALKAQYGS